MIVPLPKAQSKITDPTGIPTREWYNYFRSMLESAEGNPALEAQIQAILIRLEALEEGGTNFQLQGLDSVVIYGTPTNGFVKVTLDGDTSDQGGSWYYGSGPDSIKGWYRISDTLEVDSGELTKSVDLITGITSFGLETVPDGGVAPTLLKVTRDGFGRVNNTQEATAYDVPIAKLGSATWDNVQEAINVQNSPGLIDGGSFYDAGGGNLSYSAMRIAIRPTDSDTATLYMADIAAGVIAIPNDSATRFVGVQYNGGSPNVIIKTADSWDYDTEFPLGEVANLGGTLYPLFNPYKVGDPITNVIQRFDAQAYAIRSAAGGLELSTDGTTRNLAMTAGVVWTRLNDHPIAARNSPTFPLIRITPTGGTPPLAFTPGFTAWPNTQYISGTTLTTLGNNKWANLWVFVNIGTGAWGFAHGTAEYNNSSSAAAEAIPAYLTSNFLRQNIFVGRLIFEKNFNTAIIESAFTRVFSTQAVSNHNQLSGLQGGLLNEYYHLTDSEHTGLTPWSSISPSSKADDSLVVHKAGSETITGDKTFATAVRTASVSISSVGGTYEVGSLYSDSNWGMLIRGASSGLIGNFSFHKFSGEQIFYLTGDVNPALSPGVDNLQPMGQGALRWSVVYAGTGTINTSDAREKTPVRPFIASELAASAELGSEIGVYQWLAMISEKGEAARQHIGMTVQRAIEIMQSHGLDPFAYGFICYDEWPELPEIRNEWPAQPDVVDDFGVVVSEAQEAGFEVVQEFRAAGNRYSFRMDELLAFIARGISHRLSEVERRLDSAGL